MAHALRERTARVLTDYLQHCAREPDARSCDPSTPEAAALRRAADQLKWSYRSFFVSCRDFRGNRAELLQQVAQEMLADGRGLSWHRVVALVTFAGTLVDRLPPETHGVGVRRRTREEVDWDCQCLVDVLCNVLVDQNGAWLEAHGGWVSWRGAGTWDGKGRAVGKAPAVPVS
ncbi:PREDICTED: bcl-2-like protein 10 [Chrysochloris asiatica]|uniref:Bcl-2-like protein 10 n=1 Tax=Chrysochloris asiatica TaxID=185453 RepID=A0A9B0SWU9_CHRAS|nr:PREDICTED: bcl-2-like protein 10 [Chrysochloris asiatica]